MDSIPTKVSAMPFRIAAAATIRNAAKNPTTPILLGTRAFHSPYDVLGTPPPVTTPPKENTMLSVYEKHYDHPSEPVYHSGRPTYVVSEPDAHSKHYQVPAGAYPISVPYVNFAATSAPDTAGMKYSSTAAELLANGTTTTTASPRNPSGLGESSAIRNARAPGLMGTRGGGYGGLGLMDKKGTMPGTGQLADRNSPPDGSAAQKAQKSSKAGVKEAWKSRK